MKKVIQCHSYMIYIYICIYYIYIYMLYISIFLCNTFKFTYRYVVFTTYLAAWKHYFQAEELAQVPCHWGDNPPGNSHIC